MVKRKIFSTIIMMVCCVAVMTLVMIVAPAQATSMDNSDLEGTPVETLPEVTPSELASEEPAESPAETESVSSEAPAESESPVASESPQTTTAPPKSPSPTQSPSPTVPPTAAPTTPPKLDILTPPVLATDNRVIESDSSLAPEETGMVASPNSTLGPTTTEQVEHVEQVEIDLGFRMSDFIGILCYIVYALAGLLLLVGFVRIAILLIFKKDILPSKAERLKAKEEKERQEAIKRQTMIQTDVTPEEFNIHKDDWNWK